MEAVDGYCRSSERAIAAETASTNDQRWVCSLSLLCTSSLVLLLCHTLSLSIFLRWFCSLVKRLSKVVLVPQNRVGFTTMDSLSFPLPLFLSLSRSLTLALSLSLLSLSLLSLSRFSCLHNQDVIASSILSFTLTMTTTPMTAYMGLVCPLSLALACSRQACSHLLDLARSLFFAHSMSRCLAVSLSNSNLTGRSYRLSKVISCRQKTDNGFSFSLFPVAFLSLSHTPFLPLSAYVYFEVHVYVHVWVGQNARRNH